ncbi:MAG: hypothetical protein RLY31_504 [Bacteroidota bacterium]
MTDEYLPFLKKLALEAGQAALDIYQAAGSDLGIETKADQSPLTVADKASNDIICRGLEALTGGSIPIISEENKEIPWETRRTWTSCWLVDPLDGTKEFIRRNGDFTINIALVENGEAVMGVVHVPVHGELAWAVRGGGAFQEKDGRQHRLQAATYSDSDKGLSLVCSRSHMSGETTDFIARFAEPQLVSRGSALKFLLVASGKAHLYPRLAPTMEWDTAAAQIIVEEAGGRVLEADSGNPLRYNKADLRNPSFIASGRPA